MSAGKAGNTSNEIPSSSRAAYGFAAFLGFAPFRMATLRKTSRGSLAILLSDDLYIYCFTVCVRFLQQQAAAHRRTNIFRVILSGVPQSQILGYVLYKHAERSRSFAQANKP